MADNDVSRETEASPGRSLVTEALVWQGVSLAVTLGVLWAMGPGRYMVPALLARARAAILGPQGRHEAEVRQFAAEVSRWDHEQAEGSRRKAAGRGPCGCGGLPPPWHR